MKTSQIQRGFLHTHKYSLFNCSRSVCRPTKSTRITRIWFLLISKQKWKLLFWGQEFLLVILFKNIHHLTLLREYEVWTFCTVLCAKKNIVFLLFCLYFSTLITADKPGPCWSAPIPVSPHRPCPSDSIFLLRSPPPFVTLNSMRSVLCSSSLYLPLSPYQCLCQCVCCALIFTSQMVSVNPVRLPEHLQLQPDKRPQLITWQSH